MLELEGLKQGILRSHDFLSNMEHEMVAFHMTYIWSVIDFP